MVESDAQLARRLQEEEDRAVRNHAPLAAPDALFARRLQEEEDRAARNHAPLAAPDAQFAGRLQEEEDRAARKHAPALAALRKPLSPVDPKWETLDPNPDLHSLFVQFNQVYFWSKLVMCEVKWSPRMTTCAGRMLTQTSK